MAEYIEREKLIKEIADIINTAPMIHVMGLGLALGCARSAPAADVAPVRHGRWERHFSRPCVYADMFWHCSVCGYKNAESSADAYHHYCPNCGSKMDGDIG